MLKQTGKIMAAVTIAFCGTAALSNSDDDIKKRLAGKTIVSGEAQFSFRRNGRITGSFRDTKFKGAWTARDGKFCRTLTEPEAWVGTECQPISFGEGTVTITGRNGPIEYTFK